MEYCIETSKYGWLKIIFKFSINKTKINGRGKQESRNKKTKRIDQPKKKPAFFRCMQMTLNEIFGRTKRNLED